MDSRPLGDHQIVALVPARLGSKRCPGKNFRRLGRIPLYLWSVNIAKASGLFTDVVVSTDLDAEDATNWTYHRRKPEHATDDAPDYLWVNDVMQNRNDEIFCLLRPTSPFRTVSTLRRCYAEFIASGADSIRAIEPVKQHPGKMWRFAGRNITPVLSGYDQSGITPWHSMPTQTLPPVYVQNASLEMAWTRVLQDTKTISGHHVAGFLTDPIEGFDINTEADFTEAERLALTWTG